MSIPWNEDATTQIPHHLDIRTSYRPDGRRRASEARVDGAGRKLLATLGGEAMTLGFIWVP